jgi:hypothetical protein
MGDTLSVGVIDVDGAGADYTVGLEATWDPESGATGRFIHQHPELLSALGQLGRDDERAQLLALLEKLRGGLRALRSP